MQFLPAIVIYPIAVLLLLLIGWSMRVPGVTRFVRLFAVLERDLHTVQKRLQNLTGGTASVLLFSANTQL